MATRTTHDLQPVGPEERHDPADRAGAPLSGGATGCSPQARAAPAQPPRLRRGRRHRGRAGRAEAHLASPPPGRIAATRAGRDGGYQAVAVAGLGDALRLSSQRSASIAALQPSPAAVTAWR